MSVTPTNDALIVALDFESCLVVRNLTGVPTDLLTGLDGVKRSPQEEALLVLFNAAISNLVSRSQLSGDPLF